MGIARIRHGYDYVGPGWSLQGQLSAQSSSDLVHILTEDLGVGPGKIDKLKDAEGVFLFPKRIEGFGSALRKHKYLTRLDIPYIPGSNQIKSAGFRSQNPSSSQFTQGQWPPAPGIAGSHNLISGYEQN